MNQYKLNIPDSINSQIVTAHKQSKFSTLLPSQFIKHLVTMGLREYQVEMQCDNSRREDLKKAAGCKTAPEVIKPEQRTGGKIIPFPGVTTNHGEDFQNSLDDFLREMGYIE